MDQKTEFVEDKINRLKLMIDGLDSYKSKINEIHEQYMISTMGITSEEKQKIIEDHDRHLIWIDCEKTNLESDLSKWLTTQLHLKN